MHSTRNTGHIGRPARAVKYKLIKEDSINELNEFVNQFLYDG